MTERDTTSWEGRLREERIRRNWRQSDLAEHLGTSVVTIQRWEKGSQQPGPYFRIKLVALFGKSAEERGPGEQPVPQPGLMQGEGAHPFFFQTDGSALWNVPHPRNPHFTGREEQLENLWRQLRPPALGKSDGPHHAVLTQALNGLGGIGKTQIAVEYAYRAQEQGCYKHILWINAANGEAVLASFMALASLLPVGLSQTETDQRKLATAVTSWLEQCQQPWLLIVDNADDLSLVQSSLPQRGNGSVLITTRAHAVGSLALALEVETLGWLEGMQLLLHRAQRFQISEEERNKALQIVNVLDGFPLALDQAGAYAEETGCSFADYLRCYQDSHQALLARRGKQASNYPDSVATTWALSFARVAQMNPAAADLLRLCAYLSPDRIPEALLIEGRAHWPAAVQEEVAHPLAFNRLLGDLLAFSLVKRHVEDRLLSMHRLVQVVQRDTMEPEEQRCWARRIIGGMHAVFPSDPQQNVADWPLCLRYLEQAQNCDVLIQEHHVRSPEAAELLDRTAAYLYEHASYALAEPLYQRSLHIWEQIQGPEHLDVARALNHLAILLCGQGKYQQAKPLYERALRIREHALGPRHPDVASILNNLALLCDEQKEYQQAELLYRRALHIWEDALGPEHQLTAYPLCNLAEAYVLQGKYQQAEPLYQRALHTWEQALGPEHPFVVPTLHGFANLYREQERYELAELLYRRALVIQERTYGQHHPETAQILVDLAKLCEARGNQEQAFSLLQRACPVLEQLLGREHPETRKAMSTYQQLRERSKQTLQTVTLE